MRMGKKWTVLTAAAVVAMSSQALLGATPASAAPNCASG